MGNFCCKRMEDSGGIFLGSISNSCGLRLPHGMGMVAYDKSDQQQRLRYVGEFSEGVRNGYGSQVHKDGTVYEGQWAKNKVHLPALRLHLSSLSHALRLSFLRVSASVLLYKPVSALYRSLLKLSSCARLGAMSFPNPVFVATADTVPLKVFFMRLSLSVISISSRASLNCQSSGAGSCCLDMLFSDWHMILTE